MDINDNNNSAISVDSSISVSESLGMNERKMQEETEHKHSSALLTIV